MTRHFPTPRDLAGRQHAMDIIATVTDMHAQDNAEFEETYREALDDVARIREEFPDASPVEAAILTLATVMLTPEQEDY